MPRHRRHSKSAKQRVDLQFKLIMAGLCAALMLLLAVTWSWGNSQELASISAVYFEHLI